MAAKNSNGVDVLNLQPSCTPPPRRYSLPLIAPPRPPHQAGSGRGLFRRALQEGGARHVLRRAGLVYLRADPLARHGEGGDSGQSEVASEASEPVHGAPPFGQLGREAVCLPVSGDAAPEGRLGREAGLPFFRPL